MCVSDLLCHNTLTSHLILVETSHLSYSLKLLCHTPSANLPSLFVYFDVEETQGKVTAVRRLVMKSKLDIDWPTMKWSIDSFVQLVCAFEDAEKMAG